MGGPDESEHCPNAYQGLVQGAIRIWLLSVSLGDPKDIDQKQGF